jgi:general secretion pathway protein F
MSEAPIPQRSEAAGTGAARAVSLEDLIAVNDEIAALVRAGVPLARGLAGLSEDLPGRLGRITGALAERVGRGESLSTAMAAEPLTFPSVYRALVAAGLRSGRLAAVLEGLATSAQKLREVRQTMLLALLYPTIVVVLASSLAMFMFQKIMPNFSIVYHRHLPVRLKVLDAIGGYVDVWGPIVANGAIVLLAVWWYRSSRALILQTGRGSHLLKWMPGVRSVVANSQSAALAEILALLLEHGVPLGESITLAADTVGDSATRAAAQSLAIAVERGGVPTVDVYRSSGLAPLVHWLMIGGQNQRMLVPLVRHTAEVYRQRALRQADWLRFYLPALLTAGIGGTITLVYALSLFVPLTGMLKDLAL